MNDIELVFQKFMKENLAPGPCSQEEAFVLDGCRQLYESTGAGVYQKLLMDRMDSIVDWEGNLSMRGIEPEKCKIHSAGMGTNLFWMAGHSGEEKYKLAVEKLITQTKAACIEASGSKRADGRWLYQTQPFYMEYETKCHNKAEYKEVVKLLAGGEAQAGLQTEAGMQNTCWYLMALVDVLGCMSIEIYEHYRFLEEILKRIVRQYASLQKSLPYCEQTANCSMIGYVILKACNQNNLNAEKYGSIGRKLAEDAIRVSGCRDCEQTGLLMMAYAQLLSFCARADFL